MSDKPAHAPRYIPLLERYQAEQLERLALLVNIDSGSGQVEGVNAIIQYLQHWLTELNFTTTLEQTDLFGTNLVARRQGKGRTRLLLVGHIDTVYGPGAAQEQPFSIRDGLAYGPGVIDMKCGVVMCLYALRALLESGFDYFAELCVFFNNDEEVGSIESAAVLSEIARQMDVGLVLESSRNIEIITDARKGADKYVLDVKGVPAHSGAEPFKGRSAVIELAHKMLAINALNALAPGITFNVTRLSSSEALNIIPDMARCHISVRARTQQGLDMAAAALAEITAGCNVPGTTSVLTRNPGRKPYHATPEIQRLVTLAQLEGEALGLHIVSETKGGVSDANTLMEAGIPALDSLGPVGGGMHDLNREFLRVDSLPIRGALLAGLIERICLTWE